MVVVPGYEADTSRALSQSSVQWGKTLSLHRRHNRVTLAWRLSGGASERQNFDLSIGALGVEAGLFNRVHNPIDLAGGVASLVADDHQAQHRRLPGVLLLDLGHGDVELASQPLLQRPHHLPLVLKNPLASRCSVTTHAPMCTSPALCFRSGESQREYRKYLLSRRYVRYWRVVPIGQPMAVAGSMGRAWSGHRAP